MSRETGLIFVVPQAEHVIGAHRLEHDPAASRGVPAHVTLLYPFAQAGEIAGLDDTLRALFAKQKPFDAAFSEFATFGKEVLYLAADDPAPFVALTEAIAAQFPDFPPYDNQFDAIVPHLTVADGGGDFAAMQRDMEPFLPVRTRVDRAVLVEERERFWYHRAVYHFGGAS